MFLQLGQWNVCFVADGVTRTITGFPHDGQEISFTTGSMGP